MLNLEKVKRNKEAVAELLTNAGSGQQGNGIDYISLMWEGGETVVRDKAWDDPKSAIRKSVDQLNQLNIDRVTAQFITFARGLKDAGPPTLLHFRCEFVYITILIRAHADTYFALNSLTRDITSYSVGHALTILGGLADTLEATYSK